MVPTPGLATAQQFVEEGAYVYRLTDYKRIILNLILAPTWRDGTFPLTKSRFWQSQFQW
jgi:hypothetical protein